MAPVDNVLYWCYSLLCLKKQKRYKNMYEKKSFKIPTDVRKKAHKKYVKYENRRIRDNMNLGHVLLFSVWLWVVGLGALTPKFHSVYAEEHNMTWTQKTKQRIRDVFYPISNGWHVKLMYNYDATDYWFRYQYDKNANGKFYPRAGWFFNMACLLFAALYVLNVKTKNKRRERKQEATVDMMLKIPFVGVDTKQVEKLMRVAPEIVSHMSRDRSVYFDTLFKSNEYTDMQDDIMNNDAVRNMAIEIIAGHLESHPEDLEKALRVCTQNAIPQKMLMQKFKEIQK